MLLDLVKRNVRVVHLFPHEMVVRIITKDLTEEPPVEIISVGGTIEGQFSDLNHPEAPATAQVCLYRLPYIAQRYSFVGWDPEIQVHTGYGVAVERNGDGWQVAILSEDDMDANYEEYEDLHDNIIETLTGYGIDGNDPPSSFASILVDFP